MMTVSSIALLQWHVVIVITSVPNEMEGKLLEGFFSAPSTDCFVRLMMLHHIFSCCVTLAYRKLIYVRIDWTFLLK